MEKSNKGSSEVEFKWRLFCYFIANIVQYSCSIFKVKFIATTAQNTIRCGQCMTLGMYFVSTLIFYIESLQLWRWVILISLIIDKLIVNIACVHTFARVTFFLFLHLQYLKFTLHSLEADRCYWTNEWRMNAKNQN